MILLDSNILIYAALPEYAVLQNRLRPNQLAVSVVSKIEVLGFSRLQEGGTPYLFAVIVSHGLVEKNPNGVLNEEQWLQNPPHDAHKRLEHS